MPSIADKTGMGPDRRVEKVGSEMRVHVTPPSWVGSFPTRTVVLSTAAAQDGYWLWRDGMPIQNALPMLSASEREILMNGMPDSY